MRIAVQADNGDEVAICADFLSVEQAIVTLEIENMLYGEISEFESVTLTVDKARELADALLSVADAIASVAKPSAHAVSSPKLINNTAAVAATQPQLCTLSPYRS
jgi:hypothetical protein